MNGERKSAMQCLWNLIDVEKQRRRVLHGMMGLTLWKIKALTNYPNTTTPIILIIYLISLPMLDYTSAIRSFDL